MGSTLTAKDIGALRKSLQKASLEILANGDLLSQAIAVVDTAYPDELALDVLSLHLNLYRQLRALFESDVAHSTAADLVHARLAPAFLPGKPAAHLLWTSVDSSNRTRTLRAAEALSAAGRMVDKLPPPSTSSSSVDNLLVPLLKAAASSRDLAKSDLIIFNCAVPHVPVNVVPDSLVPRILAQMEILDGANLRGNIVANVLLRQSALVAEENKDQAILHTLESLFDPKLPPAVLLNVTRYLLPPLFAARPSFAGVLLAMLSRSPTPELFSSWISVAALGVSSGYLDVSELPERELKNASSHADVSVSIRALQLLVGSKNLLRKDIAAQVKDLLSANMVIASAGARSEFGSAMYAFLKKLAEIQHSLRKAPPTDERLAVADDLHNFLLTGYIDPGLLLACRHPVVQAIQALNVLRLYLEVFGQDLGVQNKVFTAERVQLLFACQMSEFTEVRGRARTLLEGAKVPLPGYEDLASPTAAGVLNACLGSLDHPRRTQAEAGKSALCIIFQKALSAQSSQDQAFAFVSRLADRLEEHLAVAEKNIIEGMEKLPLHGIIAALRDLITCIPLKDASSQEYWRPLFLRLVALVDRVWAVTKTVISLTPSQTAGKPEHEIARAYDVLGAGDDEEGEDESMDHTNLLSGCWRATKEAGELLSFVISLPIKQAKAEQVMWTPADVDATGLRFLVWMHEIRHRGTFSKIALAFTELVDSVKTVDTLRPLCQGWLQRELDVITTDSLSITRRSAALPYSVLALVASDVSLMDVAFDALNELARVDNASSSDVTKIHAFNILKIILLDARQAKILDRYFERAVMTALHAFSSPNWNVRNVGLILFSTSVHRTLASGRGSQDFFASQKTLASRQTLANWNAKYPKVIPYITAYLQDQIRSGNDASNAHSPLFPILIIVRSLRWSENGAPLAESLLAAVGPYLGSKQWQVRSVAAQAVSSLLSPEKALQTVLDWHVDRSGSENNRHGSLLLLRHLLDEVIAWDDVDSGQAQRIEEVLLALIASVDKSTPLVKTAVIDASSAYVKSAKTSSAHMVEAVVDLSKASLKSNNAVSPGYSLQLASATLCLLAHDASSRTIESLLRSDNEDVQVAVLEFLAAREDKELTSHVAQRIITIALERSATAPRIAALEAIVEIDNASQRLASVPDATKSKFASELANIASSESCVPLREAALVALGWALNLCLNTKAVASQVASLLPRLASLVDSTSDINQSQPSRWSAVAALEPLASLLFPSSSSATDSVFVELHTALLRLLQDDDEAIRIAACSIVQRGHGYLRPVNQSIVMELEWRYLSSCIEWHPRKQDLVELFYSKAIDANATKSEIDKVNTQPGEAGVLFEVEPPNLFRDPLVDVKLATGVLEGRTKEMLSAQQIASATQLLDEATVALQRASLVSAIDERYDTLRTLRLRVQYLRRWLCI